MSKYTIIVGLGNPGREYRETRHNIGFALLDRFADGASWKSEAGYECCSVGSGEDKTHLLKPMTFMNRSGEPLAAFMKYYRVGISQIVVVHDDIDLEFGQIRIRQGGSAGGHNGIRSVIAAVGGSDFVRVRLGVGRPLGTDGQRSKAGVADWVLDRFSKEELEELPGFVRRGCDAVSALLLDGIVAAQQRFSN